MWMMNPCLSNSPSQAWMAALMGRWQGNESALGWRGLSGLLEDKLMMYHSIQWRLIWNGVNGHWARTMRLALGRGQDGGEETDYSWRWLVGWVERIVSKSTGRHTLGERISLMSSTVKQTLIEWSWQVPADNICSTQGHWTDRGEQGWLNRILHLPLQDLTHILRQHPYYIV